MQKNPTTSLNIQLPNACGKINAELRRIMQRSTKEKKALEGRTVFVISREEVEALDFSRFKGTFLSHPNQLRKWRGKVVFSFAGYDDESSELYEIAEVRKFVLMADRYWGAWFYFSELESCVLKIVACCVLQNLTAMKLTDESHHQVRICRDEVLSFIESHVPVTAALHEVTGVSEKAGIKQLKEVTKYFGFR